MKDSWIDGRRWLGMGKTETKEGRMKPCPICHGIRWVCENHPDKAWDKKLGCECGAGRTERSPAVPAVAGRTAFAQPFALSTIRRRRRASASASAKPAGIAGRCATGSVMPTRSGRSGSSSSPAKKHRTSITSWSSVTRTVSRSLRCRCAAKPGLTAIGS